jgi:hypothetical protein
MDGLLDRCSQAVLIHHELILLLLLRHTPLLPAPTLQSALASKHPSHLLFLPLLIYVSLAMAVGSVGAQQLVIEDERASLLVLLDHGLVGVGVVGQEFVVVALGGQFLGVTGQH